MRRLVIVLLAAVAAGCAKPSPAPDVSIPYDQRESKSERDPKERARIHTSLAAMYYAGREYAVALEEANTALRDDSSYVPALNVLGLTYMELGQDAAAQQAFDKAISINPSDSDTRNNYGWFLCRTKHEDEAIKQFMLALRNPLYRTPEKAYTNAGDCARNKGDLKAAEDYYTQALQIRPGAGNALSGLAEINFRRGDYKQARALLDRYLQSNSPTAETLWLAVRVERKLGDRQGEADYGRRLRREFPDSAQARLLQSGKYD
jgi:type IV pilus assembly protein PilF